MIISNSYSRNALLLALLVGGTAAAEDWIPFRLAAGKEEAGVSWFIDKDTIRYSGGKVHYWLKVRSAATQTMSSPRYPACLGRRLVALYSEQEADCEARTITILSGKLLCEGNVLVDDPQEPQTTPSIPPGLDTGDAFSYCKKWYEFWK